MTIGEKQTVVERKKREKKKLFPDTHPQEVSLHCNTNRHQTSTEDLTIVNHDASLGGYNKEFDTS